MGSRRRERSRLNKATVSTRDSWRQMSPQLPQGALDSEGHVAEDKEASVFVDPVLPIL